VNIVNEAPGFQNHLKTHFQKVWYGLVTDAVIIKYGIKGEVLL
jgi:hypothetical protein